LGAQPMASAERIAASVSRRIGGTLARRGDSNVSGWLRADADRPADPPRRTLERPARSPALREARAGDVDQPLP